MSNGISGPDNQTVEVDGMNFTENCVVLNATGFEWIDVKQQTVGDVTCCEDLMITMAICERRKGSKNGSIKHIFTSRQQSCGKVMFSRVFVCSRRGGR